MVHATLIHCPRGGSASAEDTLRARELLGDKLELTISEVDVGVSPATLAREALERGSRLLIASGGDGTVSAVAGALVGHPDCSLAIIPRGTANSIATHLGIPREIERCCEIILGNHTRLIDTASVNGRTMVLMATLGVHAEAITDVDPERKKRYGALAYVLEEVERLRDGELFEVTLSANGQRETFEANAVTVANIARPATLLAQGSATIEDNDGLLDVTLVAIRGLGDALATSLHLATTVFTQTPADRDNIGHFRSAEVHIDTREPRRVMVDGEDAEQTPITVRCVPKSLRVLVPA